MQKFWIIKVRATLGPDASDDKEVSILNRVVRCKEDCLLYEADPRHVEKLLREADMGSCKEVITPGVKEVSASSEPAWFERQVKDNDEYLEDAGRACTGPIPKKEVSREEMKNCRSGVARCNYLASDRFEIAFATKELCMGMSNPTEEDVLRLKRTI